MLGVLINGVGFVQGEGGFGFAPALLHLLLVELDIIAGVDDGPADAGVLGRKIRILLVPETLLEEDVPLSFVGLLGAEGPAFFGSQELLFEHGRSVGTL